MGNEIHIIPSHQLDKAKWDNCIAQSPNGLIYATSIYLDAMATNWSAMVLNDYEYVMPLPWRKKYFTRYVYPPAFIQQLGIFSPVKINEKIMELFISNIPASYKYCALNFNYANPVPQGYKVKQCKNYLLNLSQPYSILHGAYSRSAIRNIRKASETGITVKQSIKPEDIIALHRKRFNDAIGSSAEDYEHFTQLCNTLIAGRQCFTAGAYNGNNSLVAGSIYFIYKNRLTFILNGNTPESLTCGATHLLKDYAIQQFAGQDIMLDFEGSDFESFARFYQQFGAKDIEYYSSLIINRLPPVLRALKG